MKLSNLETYSKSIAFLVLANLIPLFGVLYLGWSLMLIMILFWLENIVVGFYTIVKMKRSEMAENISPRLLQKLRGSRSGNVTAADMKTKPALISFFICSK